MVKEMPTKREEKPKFPGRGSGRNLRDKPVKATATIGTIHPSTTQLIEAMVRTEQYHYSTKNVVS